MKRIRQILIILLSAAVSAAALSSCGGKDRTADEYSFSSQESEINAVKNSTADTTGTVPEESETAPEESGITQETAKRTAEARDPDDIIEDIITYYGCYEDEAAGMISDLMDELEEADERQAELWSNILDYWEYANNDLEVNIGKLPDDLPDDDSMCIAVLGYKLNDDGSIQDELEGRLEVAISCAEQYPEAFVLCTGGGTAFLDPEATEGGVMGEWMIEHGLDEERLIIEDSSHTTAENARNSYNILLRDYPQVDSIVLITSSYHVAWGSLLFEAAFMKSASENQTPGIHVISNCAFPATNDLYVEDELIYFETGGLLQLAGNDVLAQEYYFREFEKPELP